MKKVLLASLASFLVAVPGFAFQEEGCQCKPMPVVNAKGTDGRTYTTTTLTAQPTVLVFIKLGCPHNAKAAVDLNRLATGLKGKASVIGVLDADLAKAKELTKELKLQFPLVADPQHKMIEGFGVSNSLDLALVCPKDKKVGQTWNGYSQTILKELVAAIPHHGGPAVKLDLSKFPSKRVSGCGF